MVWNSSRFFFFLVPILIALPVSPILPQPILAGLLFLLVWGLCRRLCSSPLLRELTTFLLFLLLLILLRDHRLQRIGSMEGLGIPEKTYVELQGTVISQLQPLPDKGLSFLLAVRRVEHRGRVHPLEAVLGVRLNDNRPLTGLARGARITLSAQITGLKLRHRFNLPDPRPLALARGLDGYASCKSGLLVEVIEPAPPWWAAMHRWRTRLDQAIDAMPFSPKTAALAHPLFKAVFLGHPFQGDPEIQHRFLVSGSLHLLAISGTHIALITGFVLLLFSWTPPPLRRLIVAGIILVYLLQAAAPISAQRAAIVAWSWLLAAQRKRTLHIPHILGLAGCLDLLANPFIVHSPSFLLTYTICFALAYWAEWIGFFTASPPKPTFLPRVWSLVKTQTVATATATPLTLHLFNQTAMAALPAGLFLTPLFGLILPLAATSLLLFLITPDSFHFTRLVAEPALSLLGWLLDFFGRADFLLFYRHAPPFWLVCLCLGLILAAGALGTANRFRRPALTGAFLILLFWLLPDQTRRPESTEVHVPDIGQGEMQALVFPSGRSMLIDCGGAPVGDQRFVSRQVTAWLLNNRIHPDWIAVSHFHADHCGTLPDLLPIFQPAQVLVSETPNENPVYTRARAASPRGTLWTKVDKNHRINIDDARLIWLFPNQANPPSSATSNGHSQVIRLHTPAFSMLFCGDIGTEEETRLTEQTLFPLQSDVLKVPHHGSKSSSSPHFLQTVSPRLALIHCSRHNLYGFPHPLVRERYTQFEIPLRCTWQGDLILTSRHNRLHAVSADGLGIPGLPTLCL